jgi:hypothetical protein
MYGGAVTWSQCYAPFRYSVSSYPFWEQMAVVEQLQFDGVRNFVYLEAALCI